MAKTLVVVESPAKAKTIKKYLGSKFEVLASKGHIKDLPKKLGIDIEKGFQETYEVVPGKEKIVQELKDAADNVDEVLLATDPDREGEAIAWHISEELKPAKKKTKRVEFHEITKKGVEYGVSHPRELDKNLYDAQRARRVLDRIVGYDVSALVWSKLAFGLSAGRVQSVALRLIVDREREIEAFVPVEYWNCGAALAPAEGAHANHTFVGRLATRDDEKIAVKNGDEAGGVRKGLEGARYIVAKVTKSERKRNPPAPYTTSKLQQDAVNRLGFGAKRAMQIAQGLYEGIDLGKDGGPVGLITYMRTDSTRLSPDAVNEARTYIGERYGQKSVPAQPNVFKSKKNAQDAHEAIRPTSLELAPEAVRRHLKDDQFKLYKLIWDRFLASQMVPAVYDQTSVDIDAKPGTSGANGTKGANGATGASYGLRASGRVLKFGGWLDVYEKGESTKTGALAGEGDSEEEKKQAEKEAKDLMAEDAEATLPELVEGQVLRLVVPPGVITEQKFTQPPPRYTEASLVRELEERGIGRPSTYAEIISKVQARDYVEKMDGTRFRPTTLGKFVVDGLVSSELDFMDPAFTSKMEEELDEVEAGNEERVDLLKRFYKRFREQLDVSKKGKRWNPDPVPTDEKCELCGGVMLKRWSKNGWFLGCANYPECKSTRDLGADGNPTVPRETGIACDKCGKPMVIKSGRFGEFLSCTGYPECKNAKPVPLGVPCPKCGGDIIEIRSKKRGGKTFYGCSNYANEAIKCDFKVWQKPLAEPCPACGGPFLVMGGTRAKPMIACPKKECGYKRPVAEPGEAEGASAEAGERPMALSGGMEAAGVAGGASGVAGGGAVAESP
ncbi:MAG TPA: type I DNA topoisomerase [Polyangiaceae bacterium]|nr:type I DNA topoisomerase [Polyangiaceae bacterium]